MQFALESRDIKNPKCITDKSQGGILQPLWFVELASGNPATQIAMVLKF